jgi:hypothetical protein
MVLVAPFISGITFIFTVHMHCIPIERSLYFKIFSALLLLLLLLLLYYNGGGRSGMDAAESSSSL